MGYQIPEPVLSLRRQLGAKYLLGKGLEVGALHFPMPVPESSEVKFVDRMAVSDLRAHYPELADMNLVEVDIIDDGEKLNTIPNDSQDFIIANHFLEHCEDPIRTIKSHLSKVKPGGILYYAIPDGRFTFDKDRPKTPFLHFMQDHLYGPERSREGHFREWITLVEKRQKPEEIEQRVREVLAQNYSIHFHVWSTKRFYLFLQMVRLWLGGRFKILHFQRNEAEAIAVLQRAK